MLHTYIFRSCCKTVFLGICMQQKIVRVIYESSKIWSVCHGALVYPASILVGELFKSTVVIYPVLCSTLTVSHWLYYCSDYLPQKVYGVFCRQEVHHWFLFCILLLYCGWWCKQTNWFPWKCPASHKQRPLIKAALTDYFSLRGAEYFL